MLESACPRSGVKRRIIEQRCLTGRNGATWQRENVAARERAGESRSQALHGMLADYLERMHAGDPVHTWEP